MKKTTIFCLFVWGGLKTKHAVLYIHYGEEQIEDILADLSEYF